MKKNKNIWCFLVFLLCSLYVTEVSAQQEKLPTYFSNNFSQLSPYNTSLLLDSNSLLTNENSQNSLFQQQSGNINSVVLNQVGFENNADIKSSNQTSQNVNQIGNENYYSFINYYNSSPINFGVHQQGNSNSLQIYGTNSMMNGAAIIQNSNNQALIIKNY
ncbi:hypothetical protein QWY81_09915 [Polaribacter undariae]|uniref:Curlin n=1 Tax=Polaribacter sejongensis TaxID=985043 RepID=A0AAJ1VGF2_9FLAO|nr:hypothetical protein [Polaribacter undariae]MDN3619768.1 hypothetical protein [Polaribacter undariae]UWD31534.1 hypothetical protein NQP51_15525 [Polaribacter undariae]